MQLTRYTIFRPDGAIVDHWCYLEDLITRKELDAIVRPALDGGDPEHVTVLHDGEYLDMFVDEEGAVKQLPLNERATLIYQSNWMAQHPDFDATLLSEIHGPAVLFERRVWL